MRCLLVVLLLVSLAGACRADRQEPAPSPDPAPRTVLQLATTVAQALSAGDGPGVAALAPAAGEVLVELRDALVETDERERVVTREPEALAAWVTEASAQVGCEGCRWSAGVDVDGQWHCFGDCCDLRHPGGVAARTLQLRRACFAERAADGARRLSYLVVADAPGAE